MVLTFFDVVGRYLLNRPIPGGVEVAELGMMALIFAGLPLVSHADEHVTMDFIDKVLGARQLAVLERLVDALCTAVMLFLAWQIWLQAAELAVQGDYTNTLRIVYAPFVYFMAVMTALTAFVHLYRVFFPSPRKHLQGPA